MESLKTLIAVLVISLALFGCGDTQDSGQDSSSEASDNTLSSDEKAHIVAAALTSDTGGIGKDFENTVTPATTTTDRAGNLSLNVSAELFFYDDQDQSQSSYDRETTDRIDYEALIQGHLSKNHGFFQELDINNKADFMATQLLSGTAIIDGGHSNHSSYRRTRWVTGTDVEYSLDCDLSVVGIAIDLDAWDRIPEAGTVEGTVSGFSRKTNDIATLTKELYFHFIAVYIGDNSAEIEIDDDSFFTIDLVSGEVTPED